MEQTRMITVLMVDDEQDFLDSTGKALSRRGFNVLSAANAVDAMFIVDHQPVDVVVLDVKMPGIDGHDLFRELKSKRPGLPAVFLTGHGTIKDAFAMSKEGAYEYLPKPCEIDLLAETIRAAFLGLEKEPGVERDPAARVRVLLIDDEADFLESVRKVLARRGMEVLTATSGEDGLNLLQSTSVDVAVVDIKMPGLSGLEVLGRIRSIRPEVQVILLTGHATPSTAIHGMKEGAFDYLLKPYDIEALAGRISAAAEAKQKQLEQKREELVRDQISRRPT